ncbi:hypothetical protein V3C99_016084, partial [Haemonchus contortus]
HLLLFRQQLKSQQLKAQHQHHLVQQSKSEWERSRKRCSKGTQSGYALTMDIVLQSMMGNTKCWQYHSLSWLSF